jgi:hypothetical protein
LLQTLELKELVAARIVDKIALSLMEMATKSETILMSNLREHLPNIEYDTYRKILGGNTLGIMFLNKVCCPNVNCSYLKLTLAYSLLL